MNRPLEGIDNLRTHLRKASVVSIGLSIGVYAALVVILWDMWDSESIMAIAVGSAFGVIVGARKLVDPLRFAPYVGNEAVPIDGEETLDRLKPYWRQFPKALPWAWAFLATALIGFAILLRQSEAVLSPTGLKLVRGLFVGFAPTATLCPGLFYLYVLSKWREVSVSSR